MSALFTSFWCVCVCVIDPNKYNVIYIYIYDEKVRKQSARQRKRGEVVQVPTTRYITSRLVQTNTERTEERKKKERERERER